MQNNSRSGSTGILFALLLFPLIATMITSCSTVRKATYPPGFVYLDNKQVHSSMQKMAISIDKIHQLLDTATITSDGRKSGVIEELDKIKQATDGLAASGIVSNHRVITDNIGAFRQELRMARQAVDTSAPDYTPTSKLVAQCLDCHVKNLASEDAF